MKWSLESAEWRFDNLYYVADAASGQPVLFRPRPEQVAILRAVYVRKERNILVAKARQLGISTVIALIILDKTLFQGGVQSAIVDLTATDATKKLNGKIVYAFDRLPQALRDQYEVIDNNNSQFSLRLKKGGDSTSSIQAGMHARGDTFQVLHISEWGKIQWADKLRSDEIMTGALPAAKQGIRFIETTWKGGKSGNLWTIMDQAIKVRPEHKTVEDWTLFFFPWWADPSYALAGDPIQITPECTRYLDETEKEIRQSPGNPEFLFTGAQRLWYYKVAWSKGLFRFEEYPSLLEECFKSPIEGAIYADLIDRLRIKGAIREAEVDHTALVHTSWDLGAPINTVVWFFQIVGSEIRIIDLDHNRDLTSAQRVASILSKGYLLGWHYLPHDAMATQKSGKTFQGELSELGLPNTRIVPMTLDIWVGINYLREIFPRITFRIPACERGIELLSLYHTEKETNSGNAIDIPKHDNSSHCADGLRTLAEAEMHGMIHNTGPRNARMKPVVRSGLADIIRRPRSYDPMDIWFKDARARPRVILP